MSAPVPPPKCGPMPKSILIASPETRPTTMFHEHAPRENPPHHIQGRPASIRPNCRMPRFPLLLLRVQFSMPPPSSHILHSQFRTNMSTPRMLSIVLFRHRTRRPLFPPLRLLCRMWLVIRLRFLMSFPLIICTACFPLSRRPTRPRGRILP